MATLNAHIVEEPGPDSQAVVDMYIDNPDELGGGGGSYTLPEATTSALGGVKKAASVAAVSAADATAAAGDTVTKAEFDAVVTLCNELKAKLNSALANMKSAGQIA